MSQSAPNSRTRDASPTVSTRPAPTIRGHLRFRVRLFFRSGLLCGGDACVTPRIFVGYGPGGGVDACEGFELLSLPGDGSHPRASLLRQDPLLCPPFPSPPFWFIESSLMRSVSMCRTKHVVEEYPGVMVAGNSVSGVGWGGRTYPINLGPLSLRRHPFGEWVNQCCVVAVTSWVPSLDHEVVCWADIPERSP